MNDLCYTGAITEKIEPVLSKWGVTHFVLEERQGKLVVGKKKIMVVSERTVHAALENPGVAAITGLEFAAGRDGKHQRFSTINHTLAKLAVRKRKAVIFFVADLFKYEQREVALGRLSQNIQLFEKYKVRWYLLSGARNPYEWSAPSARRALAQVLGASSQAAKAAVDFPDKE